MVADNLVPNHILYISPSKRIFLTSSKRSHPLYLIPLQPYPLYHLLYIPPYIILSLFLFFHSFFLSLFFLFSFSFFLSFLSFALFIWSGVSFFPSLYLFALSPTP